MKDSVAVAAALTAGIGIGSFGIHALHAQSKPPVYMIEDNTVIDPAAFANEFAPLARVGAAAGSQSTEIRRRDVSFSFAGTRSNK